MSNTLIGILIPVAVSGFMAGLTMILKRERTYRWGFGIGKALSPFFGRRLGKKRYEDFENRFQSTIYDFSQGLIDGLDADDTSKWEGAES